MVGLAILVVLIGSVGLVAGLLYVSGSDDEDPTTRTYSYPPYIDEEWSRWKKY